MAARANSDKKTLTNKERMFVEHYLVCWNASEAARRAGYSEHSAREIGRQNLTKLDISREIQARIAEVAMTADEVLVRLADQARGNLEQFVDVEGDVPRFDLKAAKAAKKLHLVRKMKTSTRMIEGETLGVDVEIELYDAQAALVHLGKHHKLFTEKIEGNGINGAFQHQLLTTAATELVEKSADDLKRYGSKLADLWK